MQLIQTYFEKQLLKMFNIKTLTKHSTKQKIPYTRLIKQLRAIVMYLPRDCQVIKVSNKAEFKYIKTIT